MRYQYVLRTISLVVLSLILSACGPIKPPLIPVRGELFYQGKPATGALVQMTPAGDASAAAWPSGYPRGEVNADGSFDIGTENSADGAVAGDYIITVRWMVPPAGVNSDDPEAATVDRLQGKYLDPAQSTIKATVAPPQTTLPRIDLN